jgi:5-formyltetrahydrofolate cyclo-ligase
MSDPAIQALKAKLRDEALARRAALDPAWQEHASLRIAELVLSLEELHGLSPVSAYWPIRREVDPRPILEALHAAGVRLGLPSIEGDEMVFRLWNPGDPLVPAAFGLSVPQPQAIRVDPAAMLVPLAAFDRSGGRIGYGKGYYDRTIAGLGRSSLRCTIGLAFSAQEVPDIPLEDHDERLDLIVTEAEIIRTRTS